MDRSQLDPWGRHSSTLPGWRHSRQSDSERILHLPRAAPSGRLVSEGYPRGRAGRATKQPARRLATQVPLSSQTAGPITPASDNNRGRTSEFAASPWGHFELTWRRSAIAIASNEPFSSWTETFTDPRLSGHRRPVDLRRADHRNRRRRLPTRPRSPHPNQQARRHIRYCSDPLTSSIVSSRHCPSALCLGHSACSCWRCCTGLYMGQRCR